MMPTSVARDPLVRQSTRDKTIVEVTDLKKVKYQVDVDALERDLAFNRALGHISLFPNFGRTLLKFQPDLLVKIQAAVSSNLGVDSTLLKNLLNRTAKSANEEINRLLEQQDVEQLVYQFYIEEETEKTIQMYHELPPHQQKIIEVFCDAGLIEYDKIDPEFYGHEINLDDPEFQEIDIDIVHNIDDPNDKGENELAENDLDEVFWKKWDFVAKYPHRAFHKFQNDEKFMEQLFKAVAYEQIYVNQSNPHAQSQFQREVVFGDLKHMQKTLSILCSETSFTRLWNNPSKKRRFLRVFNDYVVIDKQEGSLSPKAQAAFGIFLEEPYLARLLWESQYNVEAINEIFHNEFLRNQYSILVSAGVIELGEHTYRPLDENDQDLIEFFKWAQTGIIHISDKIVEKYPQLLNLKEGTQDFKTALWMYIKPYDEDSILNQQIQELLKRPHVEDILKYCFDKSIPQSQVRELMEEYPEATINVNQVFQILARKYNLILECSFSYLFNL